MTNNFSSIRARDAVIDRLLEWHEQAKLARRLSRADELLALAWFAYDRPLALPPSPHCPVSPSTSREFPALADLSIDAATLV